MKHQIHIRATEAEYAKIKRLAAEDGRSLSQFMLQLFREKYMKKGR